MSPSAPDKASSAPRDGRAARAARTREAIVDACIAMVEEGDLRPTAPRVAERAGVSVRSVFQHFDDLPSLHLAVSRRIGERVSVLLVPPDTGLPLDRRLAAFVEQRAALLETITPYRRAAHVHGPFSPEIRTAVHEASRFLRDEVAATFAPELDGVAGGERRQVLAAVAAAASWAVWDSLRSEQGATPDQAAAAMTRMMRALLPDGGGAGAGQDGEGSAS